MAAFYGSALGGGSAEEICVQIIGTDVVTDRATGASRGLP
jgi:hypothetical protein